MKDVKEVLATTRAEALRAIESEYSRKESKIAWYYTHAGEIEMCFFLGLITSEELQDLNAEWKTHCPTNRSF